MYLSYDTLFTKNIFLKSIFLIVNSKLLSYVSSARKWWYEMYFMDLLERKITKNIINQD